MIPTIGRDTLAAAIRSCQDADEVVVVWDIAVAGGSMPAHLDGVTLASAHGGDSGGACRNRGIELATGTHLAFLDDDDGYMPGALEQLRIWVELESDRVHLYPMRYAETGRELQPEWPLRVGGVGTPMICVPNQPGLVGRWGARYEGDFDFAASTMELRRDEPVLHHDQALALIRPARAMALI